MVNIPQLEHFDAVIFDMDGVLIDSEPLWKIAMEDVFKEVGCPLTKKDFQQTVGLRLDEVIDYWFNHIGWDGMSPKKVEERIVERMVELIRENGKPLKGVLETLEFLRSRGKRIALATSSYSILINTILEVLDVAFYFEIAHSAENEVYGKPHPAVYLTVAHELGVSPLRCLVIEDSLNGIISGKAARMKVVCIPEKTHHPEERLLLADYRFDDMMQMKNALKAQVDVGEY